MASQETDTLTLEADIEAAISGELEAINTGSADVLDRGGGMQFLSSSPRLLVQLRLISKRHEMPLRNLQISFEQPTTR
jgi:hypothetical protein